MNKQKVPFDEVASYVVICRACAGTVLAVVDDPGFPQSVRDAADDIGGYMRDGDRWVLERVSVEEVRGSKWGCDCEEKEKEGNGQAQLPFPESTKT